MINLGAINCPVGRNGLTKQLQNPQMPSSANMHVSHEQVEEQDASGNVHGQYVVRLPDGRLQTTTYTAHHLDGYTASVRLALGAGHFRYF